MKTHPRVTVLASLFLTLSPALAPAQQPAIAAPLLRRLAEAADAYRTGRPVYVVAANTPPYDVVGTFEDTTAAKAAAARAGTAYRVYGPYVTPPDRYRGAPAQVLGITVRIRRDKDTVTVSVDPRKYDAMFWTATSLDKFVIPYYAHVYGAEAAAHLEQSYLTDAAASPIVLHILHTMMYGTSPLEPLR